jgi:ATP-binding cassette, subfamily F, member 3
MISLDNVALKFGDRELFKRVSFLINPKDRIGLVGKNGAGKSTLMKIITGLANVDAGNVVVPKDTTIGYLPQHMDYNNDTSVIHETGKAFETLNEIGKEVESLNRKIEEATEFESETYHNWLNRLAFLNEHLAILDINTKEERVEQCLLGLGFKRSDFDKPTSQLSGGWRMRIEIAKILLKNPSVLLLDEPTNHLDIESIQWLENFLKDYNGAVVLISHDRAFLDNITKRTIEISLGRIYDYPVHYSRFVELKKERREQQMAAYRNQQKQIEETEKFIEKFRYKATKAVQVQSRVKQLEKIDRIEVDEEDKAAINIKFPPAPRAGKVVLEAESLSKSYGSHQVLDQIDMVINRGEKVAFVGRNGEGKTTMSRIILNELHHDGQLKLGHNLQIGYFAQNQDEIMDDNYTVFDTLDRVAVGDIRTKLRDILGAFLFRGEDVDKKVKVLSGGERSRLAIAKLLLQPYNLLVLDEPTNHLDMYSKDLLKEALKNYDGSLIIVSHDRHFLDGLVDKLYEFANKKVKEHLGGVYAFLEHKKIASFNELERGSKLKEVAQNNNAGKGNYLEKKEFEKKLRRVKRQIEEAETSVHKLEKEIERLDGLMANPEEMAKPENTGMFAKYEQLQHELEKEMQQWEKLNAEYEKLEQEKD